jgi:uncharacterized membrane protein YhiD involved in acid resistance
MGNKKGVYLLMFIFIIGILSLNLIKSAQDQESKIDQDVYKAIDKTNNTQVIIEINENFLKEKEFLGIKINNPDAVKEEIKNIVDDNNSRDYKNLISANVSIEKLEKLEENNHVEQIFVSPKISSGFCWDY